MAVAKERLHYDKVSTVVTTPGFQAVKSVPLRDNSAISLEVVLTARQLDGTARATFRRTGLFYREAGGPAQIQGVTWSSDLTLKSDQTLDIQFILGPADIQLSVRNSGASATKWVGYINRLEVR
jgi:hypothetical protein